MIVMGMPVTPSQEQAALAVMRGDFSFIDVKRALLRAGVNNTNWFHERVADRILQRERRFGYVEYVKRPRPHWRKK